MYEWTYFQENPRKDPGAPTHANAPHFPQGGRGELKLRIQVGKTHMFLGGKGFSNQPIINNFIAHQTLSGFILPTRYMAIQTHCSLLMYSTVNQTLISNFLPSSDELSPPCRRFGEAKMRRLGRGGGSLVCIPSTGAGLAP